MEILKYIYILGVGILVIAYWYSIDEIEKDFDHDLKIIPVLFQDFVISILVAFWPITVPIAVCVNRWNK